MTCPFLEYRNADDEHEFDHERPYCAASESFVSPMRADICNDRHAFDHADDCEIYQRHVDELEREPTVPEPTD